MFSSRLLIGVLALAACGTVFIAADGTTRGAQDAAPAASEAAPTKQPRREARGRLPAYYGEVVSEEQRERIYAIQRTYSDQIDDLVAQLAELSAARNAEIEAVLSAEQLAKVKELTEEARKLRALRAKSAQSTAEPSAELESKPPAKSN